VRDLPVVYSSAITDIKRVQGGYERIEIYGKPAEGRFFFPLFFFFFEKDEEIWQHRLILFKDWSCLHSIWYHWHLRSQLPIFLLLGPPE
jgi:hypothetical protein